MQRTIFVCDMCSAEQQTANHWWAIVVDGHKLHLTPLTGQENQRAGTVMAHCCGAECVSKRVSQFMSEVTTR